MASSTRLHVPLTIPGLARRGVSVIYLGTSFPDLRGKGGVVFDARDLTRHVVVHFNDGTDAEIPWSDVIIDPMDPVSQSVMAGVVWNHPSVTGASAYAAPVLSTAETQAVDYFLHYGSRHHPGHAETLVTCIKRLHGLDGDEGGASATGDCEP